MSNFGRDLKGILTKMVGLDSKPSDLNTGFTPHVPKSKALNYLNSFHEFLYYFTLDVMEKVQD